MNATLAKIAKSADTAVVARGTGQLATKKYAKMIDTHWAAYFFYWVTMTLLTVI
jgi:hypothetical protein